MVSTIGALVLAAGMLPFLLAVWRAMRQPPDAPDDPWEGNSLEWATSSPPPHHNFDRLPPIRSLRPVFDARMEAKAAESAAQTANAAQSVAQSAGGSPAPLARAEVPSSSPGAALTAERAGTDG